MQYKISMTAKCIARGRMLVIIRILHTNYKVRDCSITILYPVVSMDTLNMLSALKNSMNVCPGPHELYIYIWT